ncbi:MAG: CotH kinase family protein [Planctomycetes bacterium]|nr:CotH kinase family protein [Planctomycetota bacterium]
MRKRPGALISNTRGAYPFEKKEFPFGKGPGFGGPKNEIRKVVKDFDKDNDGRLNAEERQAARDAMKKDGGFGNGGFGKGGFGKGGFGKGNEEPVKPGPKVDPADVKAYPDSSLYEPTVLRTLFLEFENKDWEVELADFYHTDVEIPATLTVDGKKYPNVGVHFRGNSSFFTVGAGHKRSLNLSLDFVDTKQRLLGYKTLNLLNSHDDPSFMCTVLYSHIARQYLPAPKANFVKVVINGESWGVYDNVQQFNKEFLAENFKNSKGARWKVFGSPGGGGGLEYIGDKIDDYKRRYQIKSEDKEQDWKDLIKLCQTLDKTPLDKLEDTLKPILDIDGILWFLAIDNALINNDGYWVRGSDYSIYKDAKGIFHIFPHDMNEAFVGAMGGPGFGPPGGGFGGPGGAGPRPSGFELDPLIGLSDARKPLRSRLLSVPSLKAKYLEHVKTIAETSLDWKKLGPVVAQYRKLIEKEIETDTRKLTSFAAFQKATDIPCDAARVRFSREL